MPSVSKSQARLMAACAHGAAYDACPPAKVSREFNQADKRAGVLRKAEGGPVMMSQAFKSIVQPRGALARRRKFADGGEIFPDIQPGILGGLSGGLGVDSPQPLGEMPYRSVEPLGRGALGVTGSPWAPQFPTPVPDASPLLDMRGGMEFGGGGGGGMRHGGAVQRFGYGGDVEGSGAFGGDPDMGDFGGQQARDPVDVADPMASAPVGRGWLDRAMETGAIGLIGSMMGVPGLGALAGLAERAADFAESRGIATDRDPSTGISAGGARGELGRGDVEAFDNLEGALTAPAAALPPAPATTLPGLGALRLPSNFDPRRYGYGPAVAWLR